MSRPGCSATSASVDEQPAGTAPTAVAWVALEQDGPWGPRAFTQSHLDPEVGRAIEERAAVHAVRPVLIRSPGRHADDGPADAPASRRVLLASTRPGRTWLLEGSVASPTELLGLDWAALARGDAASALRTLPGTAHSARPHLLVCTNGRRDACCAVEGRPVALGAAAAHPGQVWEVTHTSGHRFAPTTVLLPSGTLHGRVDVSRAGELLRAAARGDTVLEGSRGRSTWPGPAQAAELAVRRRAGVLSLDALAVTAHRAVDGRSWVSEVAHEDGRRWRVTTESRDTGETRPESCGGAPRPVVYTASAVADLPLPP